MKRALLYVTLSVISSLSHADAGRASLSAGAVEAKTTLPSVGHRPHASFDVYTCRVEWTAPEGPGPDGGPHPPTYRCNSMLPDSITNTPLEALARQPLETGKGLFPSSPDMYWDYDGDELDESSFLCTWFRVKDDVAYELKTEHCANASYQISYSDIGYRIRLSAQLKSDLQKAQDKGYIPNPVETVFITESSEPVICSSREDYSSFCPPPLPVIPGR